MLAVTESRSQDPERAVQPPRAVVSNPVLRGCMIRTLDFFRGRLAALFAEADEALFDLAEKAESNAEQTGHFDAMRQIRSERAIVERRFRERIGSAFMQLSRGQSLNDEDGSRRRAASVEGFAAEEFEWRDGVTMADRAHHDSLEALGRRFGVLVGRAELPLPGNPLSPDHLAAFFRAACDALQVDRATLVMIHGLFEKHLLGYLDRLYPALNAYLVEEKVLPDVGRHAAGDGTEGEEGEEGKADVGGAAAMERGDGTRPADQPRPLVADALCEVERALTADDEDRDRATIVASDEIAGRLDRQLRKLVPAQTVDAGGRETIECIGMLFDYVVRDENLPPTVRALLSRLHFPYLRLAMLDRGLLTEPDHPARVFLNALAAVGIRWSRKSDTDGTLLVQMEAAVDRIVETAEQSRESFQAVLDDFSAITRNRERKAAVAEKRAVEATKGRGRLLAARKAAREAVSSRLSEQDMPALIEQMIRQPWANVMVLHHLRHGPASRQWGDAVALMDDLIWTGQPKVTAADVARLQSMLPSISERLRNGLEMVAYQKEDVEEVFSGLKSTYQGLLSEAYRDKLHMPSVRSVTPLRPITHLQPIELPKLDIEEDSDDARHSGRQQVRISARIREQVDKLAAGTWLEFTDASGGKLRAKLSWITPKRRYLFVSELGVKITDKSADELAEEISRGDTLLLDSTPVFDRALGAIVQQRKADSD